jgi:hypothetical protein
LYEDPIARRSGVTRESAYAYKQSSRITTAQVIHADLESIITAVTSEGQGQQTELYTDPFVKAKDKMMTEFLENDWVSHPFLIEVLNLGVHLSQAESLGFAAVIARSKRKVSSIHERTRLTQAGIKRFAIHDEFTQHTIPHWIQERVDLYTIYEALWKGDEVFRSYVKASEKQQPPSGDSMVDIAYVHMRAAAHFQRDVRPLILMQDSLDFINGKFNRIMSRHLLAFLARK